MKFTDTPLNQKTVTLKIKRIELCDLMLAATIVCDAAQKDGSGEKWQKLHEKLKTVLDEFDAKQEI